MGSSILKERYIKICCYYFPLFRRKMLFIGHNNKVFYKHILQENKYLDGIKCRPPKVQKLHMVTEYHYYQDQRL